MLSEFQIRPHVCSQRPPPHQPITWRVSKVHGRRVFPLSSSRRENIISETRFLLSILQWLSTTTEIPRLPTSVSQLQRPKYNRAHAMAEIITASFSVPPPTSFTTITTIFLRSTQRMVNTHSGAMMEIKSLNFNGHRYRVALSPPNWGNPTLSLP